MKSTHHRVGRTALIFLAVTVAGCGDDASTNPQGLADAAVDSATDAAVDAEGDAGIDSGGSFQVEVVDGYGSGTYAVGSTVHVWSAASTTDEVVLPWSGDASLLVEPNEWHSSFVMPAHDVSLVSNKQSQTLALTVEQYTGSTNVPKTVRYYMPPALRGVVIFSHGTDGSSNYIESPEAFALALALVQKGYGVLGTEAEEAVAGDLNGDGKIRWAMAATASNVDLKNLQVLFAGAEEQGLIPAGTPKFALGMSAGGAFSHFLGTVGATSVANSFPQLRFNAVLSYCADATGSKSPTLSTTPSAWFMCGAEDHPDVSLQEARDNEQTLRGRGIPTDYVEHPPSPLYDERFTRIPGISADTSAAMAVELRTAGFVDAAGFVSTDGDQIGAFVQDNPASFPTILAHAELLGSIRTQVKVMRAEHAMYSDYAQRNIAFFEQFNPSP